MLKTRGLDASMPARGALRACYDVAVTALMLSRRESLSDGAGSCSPARHAAELHRVSGALHRIAESECNYNFACGHCRGDGCSACAETGSTLGRKMLRLRAGAEAIAKHYGLLPYFQTDPRGCSLYLIPSDIVPQSWADVPGDPLERYVYPNEAKSPPTLDTLRRRWIEANHTRGHAVARVGR